MHKEEGTVEGMERRSFLKRSAVVAGATVWATPTVQSLMAPAFAAGTGACPPANLIRFKYEIDENRFDSGDAGGTGCYPDLYHQATHRIDTAGNVGTIVVNGVTITVTVTSTGEHTATVQVSASGGTATVLDLAAKGGSTECDDELASPVVASGNPINVALEERGISYVAGTICVPTASSS